MQTKIKMPIAKFSLVKSSHIYSLIFRFWYSVVRCD